MTGQSWIIRFPDEKALAQFRAAVAGQPDLRRKQIVYGEFMPDAIVRNVSETTWQRLKRIAHPKAKFFEDIQFETVVQ